MKIANIDREILYNFWTTWGQRKTERLKNTVSIPFQINP